MRKPTVLTNHWHIAESEINQIAARLKEEGKQCALIFGSGRVTVADKNTRHTFDAARFEEWAFKRGVWNAERGMEEEANAS